MHHEQDETGRTVDRRQLLRRAGTVAAGVAGAGVVTAAVADPAAAAPGDSVILGRVNDVGTAPVTTIITSDNPTLPTLELTNNAVRGDFNGPALRLTPAAPPAEGSAVGSISADAGGTLWSAVDFGGDTGIAFHYTNAVANITVPLFTPVRVLDTRAGVPAPGRANIINPAGNLDSSGRVLAGRTIHIDLGPYVFAGLGMLGNLTVISPVANGFVTVYPFGFPRPNTSNISFPANTNVSNFTAAGIGFDPVDLDPLDAISIFTPVTTHIILDIMAFIVGSYDQVAPGLAAAGSGPAAATSTDREQAQVARQKRALAKIHQLREQK